MKTVRLNLAWHTTATLKTPNTLADPQTQEEQDALVEYCARYVKQLKFEAHKSTRSKRMSVGKIEVDFDIDWRGMP